MYPFAEDKVDLSLKLGRENVFSFSFSVSVKRLFYILVFKLCVDTVYIIVPEIWEYVRG